ncbi:DUF6266 family protein [Pedobacter nyackensis]|uniref:DUF6266 family protein n=1 Tax=Pedobacter nyackensis TaxID=475255 RepID=UPI00292D5754|nr:DUF6266 family protein [Pedobacter nyackensis]
MAKLKKGIFGPLSGKLGNVIGSSWKGIAYIREETEKKENPPPRSPAQIANEQKMNFVNTLLMPFHTYIEVGFQHLAIQKTALSAAYSQNFHHAVIGVYPDLSVDYSKFMISKGALPGLISPNLELTAPDTLTIDWEDNTNPVASYDDLLMLVVYSPELHFSDGFIGGVKRASKIADFTFDPQLIGKELEVYLGLVSSNGKKVANSVYMGRITP